MLDLVSLRADAWTMKFGRNDLIETDPVHYYKLYREKRERCPSSKRILVEFDYSGTLSDTYSGRFRYFGLLKKSILMKEI